MFLQALLIYLFVLENFFFSFNIVPLFKKDNRHLKTNYRPVSLLPSLSKICEN